jgi:hypothetical protein
MHSSHSTSKKNKPVQSQGLFWILGVLRLLGLTTGLVILLGGGKWLVREDPLEQATAIAVLSGNTPVLALEAARLYHNGYAEEIWLTNPRANPNMRKVSYRLADRRFKCERPQSHIICTTGPSVLPYEDSE